MLLPPRSGSLLDNREDVVEYKTIDLASYKRKNHFLYFNDFAYPYVGTTVNVDISALLGKIKEEKLPFFLSVCYCASRAANCVPELRQRIRKGEIIEFDRCRVSHTLALEDGTYCYCILEDEPDFYAYLTAGRQAQEKAKQSASIEEDPEEVLEKFFVSSVPWLSYSALVQPVPSPADSNPRITFGKFFPQEGKTLLPVSLLCNHALVDGVHIAAFYQAMEREIAGVAG